MRTIGSEWERADTASPGEVGTADAGVQIRQAGPTALAAALQDCRAQTLATFHHYDLALGAQGLRVPQDGTLNLPLWELGHIGWFQDWWIDRNPQRHLGLAADPDTPRRAPARAGADALYDSSRVAHASRWSLPLPDASATRADLAAQLDTTLETLARSNRGNSDGSDDPALYFFRLALLHEDMHQEAATYMAQALDIDLALAARSRPDGPAALTPTAAPLRMDAGVWHLGSAGPGFAFDNELGAHAVSLPAGEIDAQPRCWRDVLPFVEAGGYAQAQWWSAAGLAWLEDLRHAPVAPSGPTPDALGAVYRRHDPERLAPRYLRQREGGWERLRWGRWDGLDLDEPACWLSAHEAQAWCAWAGRRLPTEAEWERAALQQPEAFAWGQVWEWTASTFAPYPGFTPHPYRDYSQPWFGDRPVLRGASFATAPRLRHARYRNYFPVHRNDVPAGFRTCALG